ncbi:MAG TPA: shikimate dehydrogenase [Solirubrobacteraceae bacterium]|nr:shikimate dehydrogenase [Solirubrobacteraceae bacterium]
MLRTRLGVLGWPVAHSRSPAMHNAALAAVGLTEWRYQLLPVPPELLAETVRALPQAGFRGVNVTIPHKETALALADEATDRARAIGAANTLTFEAGRIFADNTDAPAIIAGLPFPAAGRTALVLGAGGSARAAGWALRDAGAAEVRVWNRTPARAERLCAELGGTAVAEAAPADLLVHCTSSGLDASEAMFKSLPVDADDLVGYSCVVDLMYSRTDTPLVEAALARSVSTLDGLEILVGQGALSFERFTSRPAPVEVMRAAARAR